MRWPEPRSGAVVGHYPSGQSGAGVRPVDVRCASLRRAGNPPVAGIPLPTAVLIEERSAALRVPQAPSGTALAAARRHGGLLLVAASLAIAALTLLLPSAPTYDPWSWIIWGRE